MGRNTETDRLLFLKLTSNSMVEVANDFSRVGLQMGLYLIGVELEPSGHNTYTSLTRRQKNLV